MQLSRRWVPGASIHLLRRCVHQRGHPWNRGESNAGPAAVRMRASAVDMPIGPVKG